MLMQLSPAIITSLSTIVGAIISGIIAVVVAGKQNDKTIALITYRLQQLEQKVDKHNSLDTRLTVVESKLDIK